MVSFSREVNQDENCKVEFNIAKFFAEGKVYKSQLKENIMNNNNDKKFNLSILLSNDNVTEFENLTSTQTCEKIDEHSIKCFNLPADVKRTLLLDYLNYNKPKIDFIIPDINAEDNTSIEPKIED
jgi:hypothetical protein